MLEARKGVLRRQHVGTRRQVWTQAGPCFRTSTCAVAQPGTLFPESHGLLSHFTQTCSQMRTPWEYLSWLLSWTVTPPDPSLLPSSTPHHLTHSLVRLLTARLPRVDTAPWDWELCLLLIPSTKKQCLALNLEGIQEILLDEWFILICRHNYYSCFTVDNTENLRDYVICTQSHSYSSVDPW